ncbi:MAG TPA: hypothetical protein VFS15_07390 [Kofleriaceae bacterium]|nr:hypothetical protein [Kofleriaceae bacterium]
MRNVGALAFIPLLWVSNAAADGETSPMLGASVIAGTSTQSSENTAGLEIEAAYWVHWLGAAVELSGRAPVTDDSSRTLVIGGSLRLRVAQQIVPSLFEPSDVELAVELQGIVERTWWDGELTSDEPARRGLGLALRFRGSTEDDVPRLIAESRFFVRVLTWQADDERYVARTTMPPRTGTQEWIVQVGIGAAFGGGDRAYLGQFQRRAFESPLLEPAAR